MEEGRGTVRSEVTSLSMLFCVVSTLLFKMHSTSHLYQSVIFWIFCGNAFIFNRMIQNNIKIGELGSGSGIQQSKNNNNKKKPIKFDKIYGSNAIFVRKCQLSCSS